eukprot:TRINITY_DN113064_c0_g1_i1.p1 TRINITY_DN113064_c0_g1~~TRINITY_DN113064_c0_g1_i1.p1  ORF type:complete len:427 (-),score=25.11 TRINITY_DN113064_c0_g1_i1:221-1501(-)
MLGQSSATAPQLLPGRQPVMMQHIHKGIWVGGYTSLDGALLQQNNIKHIVNTAIEFHKEESAQLIKWHEISRRGISVTHLDWDDTLAHKIYPSRGMEVGVRFLTDCVARGESVLVNCAMGRSRSCSLVVGYLMTNGTSMDAAIALVKSQRPCCSPNQNFQRQLRQMERDLLQQGIGGGSATATSGLNLNQRASPLRQSPTSPLRGPNSPLRGNTSCSPLRGGSPTLASLRGDQAQGFSLSQLNATSSPTARLGSAGSTPSSPTTPNSYGGTNFGAALSSPRGSTGRFGSPPTSPNLASSPYRTGAARATSPTTQSTYLPNAQTSQSPSYGSASYNSPFSGSYTSSLYASLFGPTYGDNATTTRDSLFSRFGNNNNNSYGSNNYQSPFLNNNYFNSILSSNPFLQSVSGFGGGGAGTADGRMRYRSL